MTFSSRALALLTTCLAPALLHAQQADSTHQLKEVAVRAPRNAREVAPGQKLQAAELQRLNALSVADALRYFSGIQLKDYGGIGGLKPLMYMAWGPSTRAFSMTELSWAMRRMAL